MEKVDNTQYMLVEKYRPQTINDIILPEEFITQIREWVQNEHVPNMLLSSGQPGLGKSTLTHVLSNELDSEVLFINASLENGIDILRSKISDFAHTCSFDGGPKIVILDEADHITPNAQAAFRGFLDSFSKNCSFIFTCNYKDKIIEPLQDRLVKFDFDEIFQNNKSEIGKKSIGRLKFILDNEGIEYDSNDLKQILLNLYPGLRDMIMYIQNNTVNNVLKISNNLQKSVQYKSIIKRINDNDFTNMKKDVSNLTNPDSIYTWLWNNLDDIIDSKSQPRVILIIAKYQFQSASSIDKTLNASAMCTELMSLDLSWKI